MAGLGDNSIEATPLKEAFARIVDLDEQRSEIGEDIKAEMVSLKLQGYDPKIVRKVLAIAKKKKGEYEEEQMLVDTYLSALDLV